jgi:hypothetical protein
MTPALVNMVAVRRFPSLERKQGGALLASISWSLASTVMALLALLFSVPLWLVPPPGAGTTAFDMGVANLPGDGF